jgi:hypothetical protein
MIGHAFMECIVARTIDRGGMLAIENLIASGAYAKFGRVQTPEPTTEKNNSP